MAYLYNGVEYPSVTTITGMVNKPALLGWAANCAVDYIQERLDVLGGNTSLIDEFIFLLHEENFDKERLLSTYNLMKSKEDVHAIEGIFEQARKAYVIKRDGAADAGTQCHHAIQMYIEGHDPYPSLTCDESKNGFQAFLSWESKNHVEWLESEVEVVCTTIGYAGRFDAIAIVNGHRYLIDFKTSKGIWDEMYWQVCAYRQAYNEMFPERPIDNLAVLHLDKEKATPTFKPVEDEIERKTIFFNHLVNAYYFQCNRKLKNNPFVEAAKGWGTIPF